MKPFWRGKVNPGQLQLRITNLIQNPLKLLVALSFYPPFNLGENILSHLKSGFTLIELVMVILLLSVLAAVAIPNFQDFRTEARNAAAKGALGGVRSAIAIARAAIALREDVGVPIYPTALEMQANTYTGSHPVLNALATANKRILDGGSGVPVNPWSLTTVPLSQQASIFDCNALTRPAIRSTALQLDFGWCYKASTGEFWANSDKNSGTIGNTENNY